MCISQNINGKLRRDNDIVTKADKGRTVVIFNRNTYTNKVHEFIKNNRFNKLNNNPTSTFVEQLKNSTLQAAQEVF